MSESCRISIVLPVYRQADHISGIVRDYCAALSRMGATFELILVVNGSGDRSLEVCRELSTADARVRTLHSPEPGWGRAVRVGLAEATGDIVCYTNSARTSPQDLVVMLSYGLAFPDVVVKANRKIRESWRRRLGSLLYNLECRALFDLQYWDINGTPKVFPRSFEKLLRVARNDDLIDLEFNVVCRRANYKVVEVPIISVRRHGGKSTTNWRSAVKMYWGAYRMWRDLRGSNNQAGAA